MDLTLPAFEQLPEIDMPTTVAQVVPKELDSEAYHEIHRQYLIRVSTLKLERTDSLEALVKDAKSEGYYEDLVEDINYVEEDFQNRINDAWMKVVSVIINEYNRSKAPDMPVTQPMKEGQFYECNEIGCGWTTFNEREMMIHMKDMHDEEPPALDWWSCEYCPYVTHYSADAEGKPGIERFEDHVKNAHRAFGKYIYCQLCHYKTNTNYSMHGLNAEERMEEHINRVHNTVVH